MKEIKCGRTKNERTKEKGKAHEKVKKGMGGG